MFIKYISINYLKYTIYINIYYIYIYKHIYILSVLFKVYNYSIKHIIIFDPCVLI